MEGASKLDDDATRAKIDFVRAEAARIGRDPNAIEISNFAFVTMLADSASASRTMREGMATGLGIPVDTVGRAPMTLIGTPEEMVAELRRRAAAWGVREVVFQFQDEAVTKRLAGEVMPALRD
jgi:alkanesulfonate monooxygenase SsuD/methylene tetrahydromethanopterin reductase-like flavin-dependent oxidoreductase (luciferase family)